MPIPAVHVFDALMSPGSVLLRNSQVYQYQYTDAYCITYTHVFNGPFLGLPR